jgi:hypothetical protein
VAIVGVDAAARRRAVAERFAPTLFQEVRDPRRDAITAFDFDGDWDGRNNAAHVVAFTPRAVVYYTVVETATHWFVQYMPYHAVDYKRVNGHSHDSESILLVVRKEGERGRLEVMETRFHKVWYQYAAPGSKLGGVAAADDLDGAIHLDERGHPMVYVQRVGHGLCGGVAPMVPVRELELFCDHRRAPQIQERGVVYRYTGAADAPELVAPPPIQERGYALAEIGTTLWAHQRDPATFGERMDYRGERCARTGWRCPRAIGQYFAGDGAGSAEAPWGQTPGRGAHAAGDQFFDPAFTLARRLRIAAPYALDYVFNPYLGIEDAPAPRSARDRQTPALLSLVPEPALPQPS